MTGSARVPMGALIAMLGVLGLLVGIAWARGGAPLVRSGTRSGLSLLVRFAPLLVLSFLAAGLAEVLLPKGWIRSAIGAGAGVRGIAIAVLAGALTPAGPYVSLPLALVLARGGAGTGSLVAYVTGWALVALHRLVAYEIPILGPRLALLRWGVSLPFPFLAGLLARAVTRS